jgi:hypothetical protein
MAEKIILCPLMGGECIKDGTARIGADGKPETVACRFWITVRGKHPQTGADIDAQDCSFAWTPMLMIENTKVNRETGAAIESFRNESVTGTRNIAGALIESARINFGAIASRPPDPKLINGN